MDTLIYVCTVVDVYVVYYLVVGFNPFTIEKYQIQTRIGSFPQSSRQNNIDTTLL